MLGGGAIRVCGREEGEIVAWAIVFGLSALLKGQSRALTMLNPSHVS